MRHAAVDDVGALDATPTARRHASIFGIMPESSFGRRPSSSPVVIEDTSDVRSGQSV